MQFSELNLTPSLDRALHRNAWSDMTEVQRQCIPYALAGTDVLGIAKTGSGKTLAFLVPCLQRLLAEKPLRKGSARGLILSPTRELAKQTHTVVQAITSSILRPKSVLLVGGHNYNDQYRQLRQRPELIIATPGRLVDHLNDNQLFLDQLEFLIIDEADRMLDMGFANELTIVAQRASHRKRQTMVFSATMESAQIQTLCEQLLRQPKLAKLDDAWQAHPDITSNFHFADHPDHKDALVVQYLKQSVGQQALVFVATRVDSERVAQRLKSQQLNATALHGELPQGVRNEAIEAFRSGGTDILVTTDLSARGMDLPGVHLVINYDLPLRTEEYIHRIGRTGRAGNQGSALSLVSKRDWASFVKIKAALAAYNQEPIFIELAGLKGSFSGETTKTKAKSLTTERKRVKKTTTTNRKVGNRKPAQGVDAGMKPVKKRNNPMFEDQSDDQQQ